KLATIRKQIEAADSAIEVIDAASVEARMLSEVRRRVLAEDDPFAEVVESVTRMGDALGMSVAVDATRQRRAFRHGWARLSLEDKRTLVAGTLSVTLNRGRGPERIVIEPR